MKGITHFVTGVAIATFFPEVVQQAAGGSLMPMLGGIGGILPDTLDFRFARYLERYDVEIDPGAEPDAQAIVRLTCSGAPCVADALHIRSKARYNDGSPVESITLWPMDGIIFRWD